MSWEAIIASMTLFYMFISGIIGWWTKSISASQKSVADAQTELARDMKKLEVMLPNDYVKKTDLDARLERIERVLDQIVVKLDSKMDKA
jgi:hypothetical protein